MLLFQTAGLYDPRLPSGFLGHVGYFLVISHLSKMRYQSWIHWLPALGCASLIFWLSHQSQVPVVGRGDDFIAHGGAFVVFVLTLGWGLTSGFKRAMSLQEASGLWVVALLYGLSDEYHQSFVPGRCPSFEDAVADGMGSLIGALGSWLVLRRMYG